MFSVEQVNVIIVPKQMYGDKEVVKAKLKQLADWKTFDVYDEFEDLGQEKITGTWVVVKKEIDGKEDIKARWVAEGFQEAREIKTDSSTVSKLGIRELFAIAASKEWPLEVSDVKSAFLQGDELDRELYMDPAEEKKPSVIWRLDKAFYGLNDAPLKWYELLDKELITLGCVHSKLDTASYIYREEEQLAGMACIHVDDVIVAGNKPSMRKYYVDSKMHF